MILLVGVLQPLLLCACGIWVVVVRRKRRSAQGRAEVMVMDDQQDPDATQVILAIVPGQTNAAQVYVASLAPGSRRTMHQSLAAIAELLVGVPADPYGLPWGQVRFEHVAAVRAQLAARHEFTTANKMLSALRGTLKVAWQLGQMSAEEYQAAVSVKAVSGETLPAGRALDGEELHALLAICQGDATAAGIRDAAIVAVLYGCGLRRAELAALDLDDYDARAGSLRVMGKRNKRRIAYLANAETAFTRWLAARGDAHGPLFCHVSVEGVVLPSARLSESGIYKMLQRRATEAGLAHISPHDFRRTFVGDLLDAGVDIATVQQMAGHANITTTARYDRRPDERKKKAASLLKL